MSVNLITPITETVWSDLTPKQKWDVRVALRGPDCHSRLLKHFTTAIIRHTCREAFRVGGDIVSLCPAIILPERLWRLNFHSSGGFAFNGCHFLGHVSEASQILAIPHVTIPNELWTLVFGSEIHNRTAALLLFGYLKQGYTTSTKHPQRGKTQALCEGVASYIEDHWLGMEESEEDDDESESDE